jgi:hypothetical protein
MTKRTKLNVTQAVEKFTTEYGAYFDKASGEWFVDGDVPVELEEFVECKVRSRDYTSEYVPQCDECGNRMITRTNSATGEPFWGCCTFPRCRCMKRFDIDAIKVAQTLSVAKSSTREQEDNQELNKVPEEIKDRAGAIIRRAIELFCANAMALKWLNSPKFALGNKTPFQAMIDSNGCAVVERILEERFE